MNSVTKQRPSGHNGAFYTEALILVCIFVTVILLITKCFGAAVASQHRAGELTDAVTLARSAAEGAAEAASPEDLAALMVWGEPGPEAAAYLKNDPSARQLSVLYNEDLQPDEDGKYLLRVTWSEQDGLVSYRIGVENAGTGEEIYSLNTASFPERGKAS